MIKCAWCDWDGDPKDLRRHVSGQHLGRLSVVWRGEREIDLDIEAAEQQVGHPIDADISDGNADDEDLSDSIGGLQ